MNRSPVEQVIRDRLGIDPAAVGESAVAAALAARMRATGAATPDTYFPRLADTAELDALADELVVPETWFFRGGRRMFDAIAGHLARRSARAPDRVARALSVPCSTGEEPFSLAIALSETGLASDRFRIDAVDISAAHLARATAALYSASAFREPGPDPRPVHFRLTAGRWEL
ncbi:MAG: CheR family methyltransferase, partial [Gemmataceae bacterium]